MSGEPTYEEMMARRGGGRRSPVRDLVPGVPVKWQSRTKNPVHAQQSIWRAARRLGIAVTAHVIDGEVWAVRLLPEDVDKQ